MTDEQLNERFESLGTGLRELIKAQGDELRAEMKAEGVETRRHFDVVAEDLDHNFKIVAEGYDALRQDVSELKQGQARLEVGLDRLDLRVLAVETHMKAQGTTTAQ